MKPKAAGSPASAKGAKHDHDAEPVWIDQVEGDGPTLRRFRACQVAGCTVRVDIADDEADEPPADDEPAAEGTGDG